MPFEPPELDISDAQPWPGTRVVAVTGELHVSTAPDLRAHLARVISLRPHALVLDLSGLEFIDSTGLSVLLGVLRRLDRQDARLAIASGNPTVLRLFHITGLELTFDIHATLEQALEAVGRETIGPEGRP